MRALERLAGEIGSGWLTGLRWPTLRDVYRTFTLSLPSAPSFRERSAIVGVRLALQDIAVDLCLLGTGILGAPKIGSQDVRQASAFPLGSLEAWLETFSDRSVPVHSAEGAEALLELVATDLEDRVVDFSERAAIAAKAARFALDHHLYERCRGELRRAADCLLAYGYRKDVFVFEVLSAVRLFADQGDQEARAAFLSLAKEIEAITDYTDGAETRHARSKLHQGIAHLFPERVPALYAQLIAAQEWYRAEELAKTWTEKIPAESEPGRMLLATLISPGEFNTAWEAAGTMTDGTSIRETLGRLTGRDGPLPEEGYGTSGSSNDEQRETPDVSEFDPGHLSDFVRSAREDVSLTGAGAAVSQWLACWDAQGRHADALDDFDKLVRTDGVRFDLVEALDTAFEVSRNREGRSRAYVWLVRAMVERQGVGQVVVQRREVSGVCPGRCAGVSREVGATSSWKPPAPSRWGSSKTTGISVGLSRLVYFLVEVGENELAKRCAMEMVEIFRNEVSAAASRGARLGAVMEPSLGLLLERLLWPVPRVRWEAARALARLVRAGNDGALDALLGWTAKRTLESECLLGLGVIHAFDLADFCPEDTARRTVLKPSLASDWNAQDGLRHAQAKRAVPVHRLAADAGAFG